MVWYVYALAVRYISTLSTCHISSPGVVDTEGQVKGSVESDDRPNRMCQHLACVSCFYNINGHEEIITQFSW